MVETSLVLPHFSDPEAKKDLEERKLLRDAEWNRGVIGDAAYVLSLTFCGYTRKDAETELSLLKLEKKHDLERKAAFWKNQGRY